MIEYLPSNQRSGELSALVGLLVEQFGGSVARTHLIPSDTLTAITADPSRILNEGCKESGHIVEAGERLGTYQGLWTWFRDMDSPDVYILTLSEAIRGGV
jgi:hypothetical protein